MRKILYFCILSFLIICGNAFAQFPVTNSAQHPYKHQPKDLQVGSGTKAWEATGYYVKISASNTNLFSFGADPLTGDSTINIGDGSSDTQSLIFHQSGGDGTLSYLNNAFTFNKPLTATSYSSSGSGQSSINQGLVINASMGATSADDTEIRSDTMTPLYVDAANNTLTGLASWVLSDAIVELPNTTTCVAANCNEATEAGRVCIDTDATSGQQWYICEGVAGWVQQGGSGGGMATTDIDTSSELDTIVKDNTGSGQLVFNNAPTMTSVIVKTLLTLSADATSGMLQMNEHPATGSNYITFQVPSLAANVAYMLPADDGDIGEQLQTNGSGTLSWESASSGSLASTDIDTSAELSAIITDETGSGQIVFNNGATMTGLTVNTSLTIAEGILTDSTIVTNDVKDNTLTASDMADSLDFGGDTSFEIPNSAAPVVDTMGEIAVDSTDDQFQYMGASKRILTYKHEKSLFLESPATTDTQIVTYITLDPITLTSVNCILNPAQATGTYKVSLDLQECDSTGDNCAVTTTIPMDCGLTGNSYTTFSNSSIDANDYIITKIDQVTGTVTAVHLTFGFTLDAE